MAFIGEVDIDIYFGTNYDVINVPFYTSQIASDATKTLTKTGQVVWQTTWLTGIIINVDSYQELVGAQYVRMLETLRNNAGYHWYNILSYTQLSNKSAMIVMQYDPLLTIGIGNINKISGVMQRWSVDTDTPYKWHKSQEPLDQVDDFNYTYFRYRCIDDITGPATGISLYGFPYRMSEKPTILKYQNPNGEDTNIFMPSMETTGLRTAFKSTIGGDYYYADGFLYYDRDKFEKVVKPNLNAAVGLGYDIVSSTWAIPSTPLVTVNRMSGSESDAISSVIGNVLDVESGIPLFPTGYNNQKAADMGNYIALYNEVTGDCVSVDAADLSTTRIRVMVNPYVSGCFAARFIGYLHDPDGYSGIVKSAGWLPINYTANVGTGASMARLNNAMQIDSTTVNHIGAQRAIAITNENAGRALVQNTKTNNLRGSIANDNAAFGIFSGVADIGTGYLMGNYTGMGNGINQTLTSGMSLAQSIALTANANENDMVSYQNAINASMDTWLQNELTKNLQSRMLSAKGTIGQLTPPPTKFINADMVNANSYDFVVRWVGLSGDDRKRLDNFLTAYGYNVDGYLLTKPEQLNTRTRFTFIQATDVEISDLKIANDMTRNRDHATVAHIQERFSNGLRIWYVTPDFNYSIKNPIRGG